jgi:hypothetical protein
MASATDTAYHDQKGVEKALKNLAKGDKRVELLDLVETPGGRKLQMLQINPVDAGKAGNDEGAAPAVLVLANPLGTTPLATEAALWLGRLLVEPGNSDAGDSSSVHRATALTWYIIPLASPDGAAHYFTPPLYIDGRNGKPFDDDKDGEIDEDGPDDLNGDGLITTMLLSHPEGSWLLTEDDPPLPKEADAAKGEQGRYKWLTEGRDDDGDGKYNEDGPGGVVMGRNFPHAFEHWTAESGLWAASAPESRAILNFAFSHPEIALVLVFGETNTLAAVPGSGQKAEVGGGKYKLPKRMAQRFGVDPETEFELDTLVQMARNFTGITTLTADDVIAFLGLGAAVNPNSKDLPWWNELAQQYQERLQEAGLDGARIDPPASGPGSVEEWAYYQFGVPAFALDFWSLPKPEPVAAEGDVEGETAPGAGAGGGEGGEDAQALSPDDVEDMSRDEFLALGEKKIDAFLKANDAPAHVNATMVVAALKGGMLTPAKIAEMMRERAAQEEAGGVDPDLKALATFSRERLENMGSPGYLPWEKVTLPDGREALVGGAVPFAARTPPAAWSDSLLTVQLPFLFELVEWLPELSIEAVELDYRGADVYEVKVYVANEILEGRERQTIERVPGMGSANTRWLVRGKQGGKITITITTPSAGSAAKSVVLDREGDLR